MHIDSLPLKTQQLLQDVSSYCENAGKFLLVGGTALALQVAHRLSEDLDFACPDKKLDRKIIESITGKLTSIGRTVVYNNPPEQGCPIKSCVSK